MVRLAAKDSSFGKVRPAYGEIPVASDGSGKALMAAQRAAELVKACNPEVTIISVAYVPTMYQTNLGPELAEIEKPTHASVALSLFYERRAHAPAWSGDNGHLPDADVLTRAIREADLEGLRPGNYHLWKIDFAPRQVRENRKNTLGGG